MCYYPTIIKNKKYTANKKNGGVIPRIPDERVEYVPIGCGDCMECRKKKAREWQVRLLEDLKENKNGKFITLTFSNEAIKELVENTKKLKELEILKGLEGYELDNQIAICAVKLFRERWRKKFKKSIRHWLVTEIGHNGTENIHMHGIIWTNETFKTVEEIWKYGHIWPNNEKQRKNNFVNEKTVNYIIKYVTKKDLKHQTYKSIILTSPGVGKNYVKGYDYRKNKYNEEKTDETYRTRTGHKISLPIYWRNKIYSEIEREKLWLQKLDKEVRWIGGEKIDISKGYEDYDKTLQFYREKNKRLGYGDGTKSWNQVQYETERRKLQNLKRLAAAQEKERRLRLGD